MADPREHFLPPAARIEAYSAWKNKRTVWRALDLISSAFVLGDFEDPEVVAAASFLTERPDECPPAGYALARRILDPFHAVSIPEINESGVGTIRNEIRQKRSRLRNEPRNSILWTDVAFLYTKLGQFEQAARAMDNACALAPDNRFVVRSAARFLVHVKDYDKALRLLRGTALSTVDPWIVAAEIGVSSWSGRGSRLLKKGNRMMLSADFSEFSTSELASAIATTELDEGNRKAARKLFKQSLAQPTENSVAQAEWASITVGELEPTISKFDVPLNYEAQSLHHRRSGEWDDALTNSLLWLQDQPFSSQPATVVSHLYGGVYNRFEDAVEILQHSLKSNPGDRTLTNNLAFALINLDKLDDAELELRRIDPHKVDDTAAITLVATMGLLLFHRNEVASGRQLYLEAVEHARRRGNWDYAAIGASYLALEEIRVSSDMVKESVRRAQDLVERTEDPFAKLLYGRVLKNLDDAKDKTSLD